MFLLLCICHILVDSKVQWIETFDKAVLKEVNTSTLLRTRLLPSLIWQLTDKKLLSWLQSQTLRHLCDFWKMSCEERSVSPQCWQKHRYKLTIWNDLVSVCHPVWWNMSLRVSCPHLWAPPVSCSPVVLPPAGRHLILCYTISSTLLLPLLVLPFTLLCFSVLKHSA